jgi:hypothetical protein
MGYDYEGKAKSIGDIEPNEVRRLRELAPKVLRERGDDSAGFTAEEIDRLVVGVHNEQSRKLQGDLHARSRKFVSAEEFTRATREEYDRLRKFVSAEEFTRVTREEYEHLLAERSMVLEEVLTHAVLDRIYREHPKLRPVH